MDEQEPGPTRSESSGNDPQRTVTQQGATPVPAAFETPQIEGYRITDLLGKGGMGMVWKAVQQSTGRQVALKILSPALLGSGSTQARFEREVKLAAKLEHPHIARVYDSGLNKGLYYYAMEFVEGIPLDKYVDRQKLPRREILELMQTVCEAVQFAHQAGVIHRDLKPPNILVTKEGTPRVLDFGLAKPTDVDDAVASLSLDGDVMGTPWYMSPEQASGKAREADARSDVYSLGVMLFELLTGLFPQDITGSPWTILGRVSRGEIRRPRTADKTMEPDLEAVLVKALMLEPAGRYATAGELAGDIARYLAGEPVTAQPATTAYFLRKKIKKHRIPLSIALAVFVTVTAILTRVFIERHHTKTARQELTASAPAYYAQAEALLGKGHGAEALEKINAAIALNPQRADFHFLRGNILQSSDLKQALQAYEETIRLDPNHVLAKQNRDLCAKVISENPDTSVLPDEAMFELIARSMGQGRLDEALQMIKDFAALKGVTVEDLWRNRLEKAGLTGVAKDWFSIDARGAVTLSFNKLEITDIHALRGMPLEELILSQTSARELAPLKGMPLKKLVVSRTLVSDITPLAGMPLEELALAQTSVKDIAVLKGTPLRRLNLNGCNNIRDITPLASCENLRDLILPPRSATIEFLHRLPSLERISYKSSPLGLGGWTPSQTAEEFWKNPHPPSSEESVEDMLSNLSDDATEVSFSERNISDLSPLAGRPIRRLSLAATKVADLTPLAGMPLEELTLSQTSVRDITALKAMPLRRLNLRACNNIRDLTPLAECKELRDLLLPPNATEIEFLRRLPHLERISYQSMLQGQSWTPSQTAEEFWKNPHPASSEESVKESVEEMLNNLAEDATDVSFSQRDISDLTPLAGRPIRRLSLAKTKVTDLTPLKGMPLEELTLSRTTVRDITPLKGMPLRRLNLNSCDNIRDLTPLAECEELRDLVLPPNATDIEFLRRLPNLERVSYQSPPQGRNWTPSQTAEEFWKDPHPDSAEESVEETLSKLPEDATEVSFSGRDISDLSPLAGRPIRRLSLSRTKVTDLTPLAGMPLEELTLSQTMVRDITVLKGMPLRRLNLNNCYNIRDLTPLAECKELRDLLLPPNATEIEFLRRLPNLERISYKSTQQGQSWTPTQTAEEFWAGYDAGKKTVTGDQPSSYRHQESRDSGEPGLPVIGEEKEDAAEDRDP